MVLLLVDSTAAVQPLCTFPNRQDTLVAVAMESSAEDIAAVQGDMTLQG